MDSQIVTEIFFQGAGSYIIKETVAEILAQREACGEKGTINFTIINTLSPSDPNYEKQKDKEYAASIVNALFVMVREAESQNLEPKTAPKVSKVIPGVKEEASNEVNEELKK